MGPTQRTQGASQPPPETPAWHALPTGEALRHLAVDASTGLSAEEAERRLARHGPNALPERPAPGLWSLAVGQLREPLVLILLAAAAVSGVLGELTDAAVVLAIVVLNAALGISQERRAQHALEALKGMLRPSARVLREGHVAELPAANLVPGDVVLLDAGNRVPADVRLVQAANLAVDESALTGESVPVEKDALAVLDPAAPVADRVNMAFMGTVVTHGRAVGVAVATGRATEVGRIAALLEREEQEPTPMQRRLAELGKVLGAIALGVVAAVFAVGLARGEPPAEMFLTAVSLAVATIPEGLPAVVTVVLALGVQRMARRRAIVRRLPAVETLGAATVIATDKTGTLTENRMQVVALWTDGRRLRPPRAPGGLQEGAAEWVLRGAALANDARLEGAPPDPPSGAGEEEQDETALRPVGDPTETALLVAAARAGLWPAQLVARFPRVGELPFESVRKRMSTVHANLAGPDGWPPPRSLGQAPFLLFCKGSAESVLARCRRQLRGGKAVALDDEARRELDEAAAAMAREALRVLAVAVRPLAARPAAADAESLEQDLVFLGLVGMMDPPRPEARDAVRVCREAGVRPVMITGDHRETAAAVAAQVGLLPAGPVSPGRVVTGPELDAMSDHELMARLDEIDVYARVSPEQKLRIVSALQAQGHVVAVTGDGVNDAPALRQADIGAAMGMRGTDVARGAADMVLADDHFATVVAAIAEGRTIFDNIRKFVHYLVACNLGEIAAIFGALAAGLGRPLTAIQILWVNLVTDGFPALALGVEPPEPGLMKRPPRSREEGVFAGGTGLRVACQGLLLGGLTLGVYAWTLAEGAEMEQARTAAFATLAFSQLVHAFNVRSTAGSIFSVGPLTNRWLVMAVLVSAALQGLVLWWDPLSRLFGALPLDGRRWAVVAGASLAPVPVVEALKALQRAGARRTGQR